MAFDFNSFGGSNSPTPTAAPVQNSSSGFDFASFGDSSAATKKKKPKGRPFGSETADDITNIGSNIKHDFLERRAQADATKAAYKSGEQGFGSTAFQAVGQSAGLVGDVIGDVIKGGVKAILPQSGENLVKRGVTAVATPIVQSRPVQSAIEHYHDYVTKHPEAGRNISAGGGIVNLGSNFVGLEGGAAAVDVAKPIVKEVAGEAANVAKTAASDALKYGKEAVATAAEKPATYYKNSEIKAFTKPSTIPKSEYNKATKIFNDASHDGVNPAKILVNNKIQTADLVDTVNGKTVYSTKDAAEMLKSDAYNNSYTALRPALEQASYSTPKVSLEDIKNSAIDSVMHDRKIPDKEKIVATIEKRFDSNGKGSLQEQYPEGFDLTNLHDEKITNSLGVNYNNPDKDANFHISNAFRTTLEKVAPPELEVPKFNKSVQDMIKASEYLDALHGKAVPRSLFKNVLNRAAKYGGLAAGSSLTGGLLGGFAGYHLGGTFEHLLENLPNPLKTHFLNKLAVEQPEAFIKVRDYLGKEETARLMRPRLEAPTTIYKGPTQDGLPYTVNPQYNTTPVVETKKVPIRNNYYQQ